MIPIVVSTYPANGSQDMLLNSPIKITFADTIDSATATSDYIKLESLNDGRDIPLTFTYNTSTYELTITPSDTNAYGNNMLLGLVRYRLSVSHISNSLGETMQGLYMLEFTTVADSIEDVAGDPAQDPVEFVAIKFFPMQDSYGTSPNVVKIKCNKSILLSSVTSDSFIVTADTVTDISDVGFITITAVVGEYEVASDIASFKPYTEYTEDLGVGALLTNGSPRSVFELTNYPIYNAVVSVDDVEVTVDTDYTINLTTGVITFVTGHEPAVDATITAVTRQRAYLSDNTRYTVILSGIQHQAGLITETITPVIYSFHTAFSPLYATLDAVQTTYAVVAGFVASMDPVDILTLIRENSETAFWIAEQADNNTNITWAPPEKIVVEYVKAKTRYDVVFDKYIQMSGGATVKTLGDLTIEYGMSLSDLLTLAERLKLSYQYWENMLKGATGGRARAKVFIKGEDVDDVPDYKDRSFKDWDGTKSW